MAKTIFRRQFVPIMLMLIMGLVAHGAEDCAALLESANREYTSALNATSPQARREGLQRAARRCAKILDRNGANGYVYGNLGNCHYQAGDRGRAVLNYLRAAEMLPGDTTIRRHLQLAQGEVFRPAESENSRTWQMFFFWHFNTSLAARRNIAVGAGALFWILLLWRMFKKRKFSRGWIVACGLVALAVTGSVIWEIREKTAHPTGVIVADGTLARQGDGTSYPPAFKDILPPGAVFTVREIRSPWWRIRLSDGRECWIPANAGELLFPPRNR